MYVRITRPNFAWNPITTWNIPGTVYILFFRDQPHALTTSAAAGPTTTEEQRRHVASTPATAVSSAQGWRCLVSCDLGSAVDIMEKLLRAQETCCAAVDLKLKAAFERKLHN